MSDADKTREELLEEVARLRARLAEPEETLEALREGTVDAVVVRAPAGERVVLLEEADRLFRLIVEEMREGAAVLTPGGDILYGNRRLAEMLRVHPAKLAGASIHGFVGAEAAPLFAALLRVAERGSARAEVSLCTADGVAVPAYLALNGLGPEGFPGFCLIATDLSEQKRRQELMAVENLASSILEQALVALVVCDEAGLVLRANEAALRLAGGNPLLERFETAFPLIAAKDEGSLPIPAVLAGSVLQGVEARLERDGRSFHLLVSAGPWRDAAGRLLGTIFNLSDITSLKAVEAELRRAKLEAEAASSAKDRFLATLSHEMRTPLTPVLAALSELEAKGDLPPRLAPTVEMIRRNVELEARLIDDVLDLARIARGLLELDRRAFDLRQIVEHATSICRAPEVDARRVTLRVEGEPAALPAWGDPARLTQVFWNLVRNAVKFTPEGGEVVVRCFREPGGPGGQGDRLVVEVADRGIGIDPEFLPRVFAAFEQGGERGYERQGGLGLGLAISKTIVDLHAGRLSVASGGRGQGATFRVELPGALPEPASAHAPPEPSAPSGPARILLVEDHPDSAEVLAHLLQTAGYEVEVARSVAEALAVPPEWIDLLVSDLGLPDGSGLDLLGEMLRRRPVRPLKAIALSGYGMESDLRRSREAGFRAHVTKPVDFAGLTGVIRRVLDED
ncbi:MAG TPA: ATP-binding protein [Thermoanaerobaculia bacterium]